MRPRSQKGELKALDDENIPLLMRLYFGDQAATARRAASRRLLKWSRAFDEWMGERGKKYQKDAIKQAKMAWRRFARQCGKMPWEVEQGDIEVHMRWMQEEGYSSSMINEAAGILGSFYEWCDARRVDVACEKGFNPAKGVVRLVRRRFEGACVWSDEETEALMGLMERAEGALGKRDRALLAARLYLGLPLKHIQQLKWGQTRKDEDGCWVKWRAESEWVRLEEEVWKAIGEYLEKSGRLEGMTEGKFIFAPLKYPGKGECEQAEDWLEDQPMSTTAMLDTLKVYGRQLGIAETKLNMMALRRTAVRRRLKEGESLEGMMAFTDSQDGHRSAKFRLKCLGEMAEEKASLRQEADEQAEVPKRQARPFKPGENTTHGLYMQAHDRQAVRAVMEENVSGLDEEVKCLRRLMRGLLEREGDEKRLVEAYSLAARRLGEVVASKAEAGDKAEDEWAEDVLRWLDELAAKAGQPPVSPKIRRDALGLDEDGVKAMGVITEEIATLRMLMRNVYRRAMEGVDNAEYVRMVDLYGAGCGRLKRLMQIEGAGDGGRLARYLRGEIDRAIRDVREEMGLE